MNKNYVLYNLEKRFYFNHERKDTFPKSHRQAFYFPNKTLASTMLYENRNVFVKDGLISWEIKTIITLK